MIQRFQEIAGSDHKPWHCDLIQIAIMGAIMAVLVLEILHVTYGDIFSCKATEEMLSDPRNKIDPGLFEFKIQDTGQRADGAGK